MPDSCSLKESEKQEQVGDLTGSQSSRVKDNSGETWDKTQNEALGFKKYIF